MSNQNTGYWTNPSITQFAGKADPVDMIREKAKEVVLSAIQEGWQGPPFDPFKLADYLGIPTSPRGDVLDARIIPTGSSKALIEYNPNRTRGRVRFSIAHEIAHTLFPDYIYKIRNRAQIGHTENDDWQLELLCNIAAAEFLMPVGNEIDSKASVTIDNLLSLQKQFDVSTEAISIRLANVTTEPCSIFAAARVSDTPNINTYRLDYCIPSRTSAIEFPRGMQIQDTILSQCTAIGYTAKGIQRGIGKFKELYLECVGIPPYPGNHYPRVIGVARREQGGGTAKGSNMLQIRGNALEPRGSGSRIIAQIVNDKTPNWGAGFSRRVKIQYPVAQAEFREWAKSNPANLRLGKIHSSIISDDLYLVSMIAQHGYGESTKPRIRYAALKECLESLKEIALNKAATVHIPRIGTGYAGGNWNYVSELIDEILVRNGISVSVYTLPENEPTEIQSILKITSETQSNVKC